MPRRSISQSLTAREIEFIRAPLTEVKTKDSNPKVSESKKPPKKSKPVSAPTPATTIQNRATSKSSGREQPWVTITTRLPNQLHSRLRRAAFERSERRQEPNTIQDILAAAATAWLDKNE